MDICGIGGCKDGRKLVDRPTTSVPKVKSKPVHEEQENIFQHILEKIPTPQIDKRKSYFLRCRQRSKLGKRGQTSWHCRGSEHKPPLCVGKCFEDFHVNK